MRVSLYELYEGGYGQWSLSARFQAKDEALAKTRAETNWTQGRTPTVLTQEASPEEGGDLEVSVIYRSPGSISAIKPPDVEGSIAGRVTMAVINGILIGVVGGGVGGVAMKSIGIAVLAFVVVAMMSVLVLFRLMVPMELMMWRSKTTEAKRKTVAAIMGVVGEDIPENKIAETPKTEGFRPRRKGAFSHPVGEPPVAAALPSEAIAETASGETAQTDDTIINPDAQAPIAASLSELMQELINREVATLSAFTTDAMATLGPQGSMLQAFDRYGINLYVAGAAQELAWREALTTATLQSVLIGVLTEQGQTIDTVKGFCERLDGAQERPRFKAMLDAGRAAMTAVLDGQTIPEAVALVAVLKTWSNPHDKATLSRKYAVLLTDMIGSTDATRKLGNSGAQRMLRAHNSIIRAALKDCKGTEVKHTGDGILAIFDKSIDAVEAARAIQQDTIAYVRDNPDLPLSLRIGIEYGDGDVDSGEYFGPPFTAIEATCDAAGGGDIAVTELVKEQSSGANTPFVPLTPSPTAKLFLPGLFKLVWEPKRVYNAPPLEYRHIGGAGGTPAPK